jgi:hypothetical protein
MGKHGRHGRSLLQARSGGLGRRQHLRQSIPRDDYEDVLEDPTRVYVNREQMRDLLKMLGHALSDYRFRLLWHELRELGPDGHGRVALDQLSKDLLEAPHQQGEPHVQAGHDDTLGGMLRWVVQKRASMGLRRGQLDLSVAWEAMVAAPGDTTFDVLQLREVVARLHLTKPHTGYSKRDAVHIFRGMDRARRGIVSYDDFCHWATAPGLLHLRGGVPRVVPERARAPETVVPELEWKRYDKCTAAVKESALQGVMFLLVRRAQRAALSRRQRRRGYGEWSVAIGEGSRLAVDAVRARLKELDIVFPAAYEPLLWAALDLSRSGKTVSKQRWINLVLGKWTDKQAAMPHSDLKRRVYRTALIDKAPEPEGEPAPAEDEPAPAEDNELGEFWAQESDDEAGEEAAVARALSLTLEASTTAAALAEEKANEPDLTGFEFDERVCKHLRVVRVEGKLLHIDPGMRAYQLVATGQPDRPVQLKYVARVRAVEVAECVGKEPEEVLHLDYFASEDHMEGPRWRRTRSPSPVYRRSESESLASPRDSDSDSDSDSDEQHGHERGRESAKTREDQSSRSKSVKSDSSRSKPGSSQAQSRERLQVSRSLAHTGPGSGSGSVVSGSRGVTCSRGVSGSGSGAGSGAGSGSVSMSEPDSEPEGEAEEVEQQEEQEEKSKGVNDDDPVFQITAMAPSSFGCLKGHKNDYYLRITTLPWRKAPATIRGWSSWDESRSRALKNGASVDVTVPVSSPMPFDPRITQEWDRVERNRPHLLFELVRRDDGLRSTFLNRFMSGMNSGNLRSPSGSGASREPHELWPLPPTPPHSVAGKQRLFLAPFLRKDTVVWGAPQEWTESIWFGDVEVQVAIERRS